MIGTIVALVWANMDPDRQEKNGEVHHGSYNKFIHLTLVGGDHHADGGHGNDDHERDEDHPDAEPHGSSADEPTGLIATILDRLINRPQPKTTVHPDGTTTTTVERHGITFHFLINDILMALFFAIAAKEVWESLLPGGALSNPRKAATPLLATLGGIVGPAGLYLLGAMAWGRYDELGQGWAIPCATDIAFSYLFARLIFGAGHPAIAFLLLLAIADDAAGLVILAIFYPSKPIEPMWLLLTVGAVALGYGFRRLRLQSFWWYLLIPGTLSWLSFDLAGIHPALGLVPIIPTLPHAHTDLGMFARAELNRHDTLNEFEHWWKNPVEIILGLFGLANAGVVMNSIGPGTWLVLIGLLIGKPLGITLFTWFAERVLKLEVPAGMGYKHILSLGMVAAIGFTVALFVSTAAFKEPGPVQDSVKMGALLSFMAAAIAFVLARSIGVRPEKSVEPSE